ncbi:MAG: DNA-3-methyladenine glycosylase family protein, partial [Candidatus Thorarchaeota archaeon]
NIKVPEGYDLLSSIHSWIYPDIQPVPEQTGSDFFGRIYTLNDEDVALLIKQQSPGENLQVRFSECNVTRKHLKALVERVLGFKISFEDAIEQMSHDSTISFLVEKVVGIRPYMSPTLFEALIKTIIQQQVSYRAANIFTKRMVVGLASPISHENQLFYHFPDAITISNAGVAGIREFGFGYKSEYIHNVAKLVANGSLDIDSMMDETYESVLAALKPIRGIGQWTVDVLSLAGLGNFEVFPYGDLVIQKIMGRLYNKGERMTKKQVQEHATIWGESGTKILYLLMSAEVLGLF